MSEVRPLETFQNRVRPWMMACFGPEISVDVAERNHRFLEEALELVQSKGCTAEEAYQLVGYVFGRKVGEPHQEVGGVMVTLAALCLAAGLDMQEAAEDELTRIWTKVEEIRTKQASKPKCSPLPQHANTTTDPRALVAAALARAVKCVHIPYDVPEIEDTCAVVDWSRRSIRALIPTDHAAALEAVREQARCEEREACAKLVHSLTTPATIGFGAKIEAVILARGESE